MSYALGLVLKWEKYDVLKLDGGFLSHLRWVLIKELEYQIHGHTKSPLKSVASKIRRTKCIDNGRMVFKVSVTADT